jgi:hypothetical protein
MSKPTRLYALFIAVGLGAAGIIGFFYNGDFSTGANVTRKAVFGLLDTNGWHNVFHLTLAPIAFWVANRADAARVYALASGVLYTVMGVYGLVLGNKAVLLGLMPLNILDSVIHLTLGLLGFAAWLVVLARQQPQPSYAGA